VNSTVAPSVRSPIYRLAPWLSPTPLASLFSLLVLVWISGCNGSSSTQQPPPSNPVPSVTAVSPTSAPAGSAAFTLTVTGSNFTSSSVVLWNGSPRTTTFVSSTSLQAAITAPDIATVGTVMVTVLTPAPGGGTSSALTFTTNNPAPTVSSLSPSSALVGSAAFTLTVTGTNFVPSSTVQWNAGARSTTFVSSTSLQAAISTSDIATGGADMVTVSTPTPGGGTSGPLIFTVDNPVPTAVSLNPSAAFAGGSGFTLTVTGTNFVSSSTVQWNGSARTTTFVSSTSLQAAITAPDIATVGTAMVTVSTPAPGGGASSALTFTIKVPPPTITLLNPSSAIAGGAGFTLTITGTNFVSTSAVQWDGSTRPTSFVSSTELQAAITTADVAAIGVAKVTVVNPAASGGSSSSSTFLIGNSGGDNFATITINQAAQDIVFDPVNGVFYISVTGTAATRPNTISVLDLSTGAITSSIPAGNNPNVLAISDDSQFLYAGIDGSASVQRFTLPSLGTDISYALGADPFFGSYFALDLQVAPGAQHTTAVTLANVGYSPAAQGGITIFDDATARPTKTPGFGGTGHLFDSLQWGSDATALFAANSEDTGFDFYTLSVSSNGVVLDQDYGNRLGGFGNKIHFDRGTNLIYGDDGQVVDPNGVPVGVFDSSSIFNPSPAVMTPDSTLDSAFFAGQIFSGGPATITIQSFDLTHFTPITSINLNNVAGSPLRLIRWGQNGLAFNTSGGQVVLVGGNFVSPAPPFNLTPPPTPAQPPTPAPNAPTIASLIPSSAIAGGVGFTMNVKGTNFDSAATVQFNGSTLPTTFVSSTQLTAAVTAGEISSVGTASITVSNPSTKGGVSAASNFFIGTTGGTSSAGTRFAVTVLNQASKDIVFDPVHRVIYLSVPGTAPTLGNTVSVLDQATAKIVGEQFAGSNPDLLAISDDGQFLYAGIDGSASVQRFTLPSLGTDIKYALGADSFFGSYTALDLQVAPGAPHTTAVSLGNVTVSPAAQGGIIIFDDAIARPTKAPGFSGIGGLYDSLQWGSDATRLFAANTDDSGFDFYTLSVTSSGVSLSQDFPGAGDGTRIHFNSGTNLVYCDSGRVIDPSNGSNPPGFANAGSRIVPDSALNTAFFVTVSGNTATIQSFNLTTRALNGSITIPNVAGNPQRLIRWGENGLAFNTDGGQVYLIGGNFVH
jgi:hypothetical protein